MHEDVEHLAGETLRTHDRGRTGDLELERTTRRREACLPLGHVDPGQLAQIELGPLP